MPPSAVAEHALSSTAAPAPLAHGPSLSQGPSGRLCHILSLPCRRLSQSGSPWVASSCPSPVPSAHPASLPWDYAPPLLTTLPDPSLPFMSSFSPPTRRCRRTNMSPLPPATSCPMDHFTCLDRRVAAKMARQSPPSLPSSIHNDVLTPSHAGGDTAMVGCGPRGKDDAVDWGCSSKILLNGYRCHLNFQP